jgi:hypothetical protein
MPQTDIVKPNLKKKDGKRFTKPPNKKVENIGIEPMTPCLQGRCSSQLS